MLKNFVIGLSAIFVLSCDTNIYEFVVGESTDEKTQLEEAKTLIDNKKYDKALQVLDKMDNDSNDRRILLTAGRLGSTGLDVWQILRDLLSGGSSVSGMDDFFDSVTETLFGTGEIKELRIGAIRLALTELAAAPDPSSARIRDLGCMLAGMWTVPTVQAAQTALEALETSLSSISLNDCSGVDTLDTALTAVSTMSADFQAILAALSDCSLLTVGGASDSLNAVETQLAALTENADAGCEVPTCAEGDVICQILSMSCVYDKFADSNSTAGDGIITSCELVQNCYDPTQCFSL